MNVTRMGRLLAVMVFATLVLLPCGAPIMASYGVSNGAIQGVVYNSAGQPLEGVSVVAVREDQPPIIRSAVTDGMGNFFVANLYVGAYTLGFSKHGFRTVTTEGGDPQNRTALGRQVRAYVEPGRVSLVAPVFLVPEPGAGQGSTVTVVVADSATGQAVLDASVIVGPMAASGPTVDGRYVLQVPPVVDANGQLAPQRAIVQADGFTTQETLVTLVPGSNQNVFFRLEPTRAMLTGQVRLGFGIPSTELTQVRIIVENVDPRLASGRVIDESGNFEVTVPASSGSQTRVFNLLFVLNGTRMARVTNVVAHRAGARTLPAPVLLDPLTVTVVGSVILSDGTQPQGSAYDQVVILELGRAFTVIGGSFQASGLPQGRTFQLQVQALNPRTRQVETAQLSVTPISDGSSEPVFRVPLIVTRSAGGGFTPPF